MAINNSGNCRRRVLANAFDLFKFGHVMRSHASGVDHGCDSPQNLCPAAPQAKGLKNSFKFRLCCIQECGGSWKVGKQAWVQMGHGGSGGTLEEDLSNYHFIG
jgi:hypothetical protein